ncbi:pumilio homolog 12-like [Cornus florida]|uniref:pumilio homolog 12-like n=1 Tax=Cornus florida TaxID=4283 RepID=UPI00289A2099|nr:pumilio homolog 12-like [Cornus florida]
MKSMSGNHVVHRCLELFPDEHTKHILDVIADNCMDIATDRSGCCVLQNCLDLAQGEPKERLVADITANALVLSEDPFGNYVVQYLLGREDPLVKGEVLAQLQGNFATLSMNKFSSNVVEKCLRETGEENAVRIINEIIESKQFLSVLQDPYGNYVAQCALEISKGPLRHRMVSEIQSQYSQLHSHPHGKRVLAKLKGNRHRLSM